MAGIWISSQQSYTSSPSSSEYDLAITRLVMPEKDENLSSEKGNAILKVTSDYTDMSIETDTNEVISEECNCEGENFCFQAYVDGKRTSRGKPFNCQLLKYLKQYGLDSSTKLETVKSFSFEEVVIVTYASTNHFAESRLAIKKIRNIMNNTIAYYDVGLRPHEVNELKTVCNLVYHKVNFSDFPPHTRNLHNYAFKPIIDAIAYKSYKVYWYVDASIRFRHLSNLLDFYQLLQSSALYDIDQVMNAIRTSHSQYFATHRGMHLYFPQNDALARKTLMYAAGIQFVRRGSYSKEVLKWYLLCALDQYCMAPRDASQSCRNLKKDPFNMYGHCHRFDQSALGAIKMSIFARERHNRINYTIWNKFLTVERSTRLASHITNLACPNKA
ncbi:unnamed protein product [Auanema sp. JU1783]|nr:unnamed protein product [Auanema sp. JU1783]